ncbi:MAG: PrsW family glutamic-type intramembrane protease [Patescibacteria group bacterium]
MTPTLFAIAFLGGLIPALFWLWFWLREDRKNPEPFLLIAITFIAGMAVVPLALPLQQLACEIFQNGVCQPASDNLLYTWVIIEEVLKYAAALVVIFWNKAVDEPIDMIIYMITIALGFAALENALFIANPLMAGDYLNTALTGSFRFLGATLLHVLASGTIGVLLAFSFYKSNRVKLSFGMLGLFIAIVLHALFNFFIMDASGETILGVFLFVWMGIIVLFLLFEKVKLAEAQHYARQQNNL